MGASPKPVRRKPAPAGQQFLLSQAARSLPLAKVFRMSKAKAYRAFRRARWPDTDRATPWCPHCGCTGAYDLAPRKPAPGKDGRKGYTPAFSNRSRCKQEECKRDFSVTSGTILVNRKLTFRTLLQAVALSV